MMYESLKKFPKQFSYEPKVQNGELDSFKKFIVAGMGGSNLAADLVKILRPDLNITVHRDYGLPEYLDKGTLVVLSSYSGNTEETLSAYEEAAKRGLKRVVMGAGGELLERAKSDGVPFVKFPEGKVQPRMALGWSFLALLRVVGDDDALGEAAGLLDGLQSGAEEKRGKELAGKIKGFVPVIYASHRNKGISYVWKIFLNETGKVPAFANVLPELNHNEMNGFDVQNSTRGLSEKLFFIFIEDEKDNPRIIKRMDVLRGLYRNRGFGVEVLRLSGSPLQKIFTSFLTAAWTAYWLGKEYGVDVEEVPMVEEFKKLIKPR